MKLYGSIKSERAEKGQGGNEFLEISVTNDKRQEVASIKVIPDDKIRIEVNLNKNLADLEVCDKKECKCTDPLCVKCLLINCQDDNCKIHPLEKKKEFREMYKNR